jgi:hypothetical protein
MEAARDTFSALRGGHPIVGRVVQAQGMVLVPVMALEAGVLQAGQGGRALPGAAAGAAELELLGLWIETQRPSSGRGPAYPRRESADLGREEAARSWLPALEAPPDGASSWSSWLRARPELLDCIRLALESAHACHAQEPD